MLRCGLRWYTVIYHLGGREPRLLDKKSIKRGKTGQMGPSVKKSIDSYI